MKTEIITEDDTETIIKCTILRETDGAIMLTGTKGSPVWIPKSQIEITHGFDHDEIIVPNWLILEKDIV